MKIIPVLDILDGQVVHGRQGKRETYKPISSRIVGSADPDAVVTAFTNLFGLTTFYVADLNAIQNQGNNYSTMQKMKAHFPSCLFIADFGIHHIREMEALGSAFLDSFVIGTETLESLDMLDAIIQKFGVAKIIMSLDLKNGALLHVPAGFQPSLEDFLQKFTERRITEIIVIDIARVGSNAGPTYPALEHTRGIFNGKILVGGGVRGRADLELLQGRGFNGVLIATAFHAGNLAKADIAPYL